MNGDYVVAWESWGQTNWNDIYYQHYRADGTFVMKAL